MGLNDGYQCAKQQRIASGIFPMSGSPTFDTQKKAECGESVSPQRSTDRLSNQLYMYMSKMYQCLSLFRVCVNYDVN